MGIARATHAMHSVSGLPEDDVVNRFFFATPGVGVTIAHSALIASAVADFYNLTPTGGTAPIGVNISDEMSRINFPTIDVYDHLVGGSPVFSTINASLPAAGGAVPLPAEVAVVASFHADLTGLVEVVPGAPAGPAGDTRPRARKRGRVFIGPLIQGTTETAGTTARPNATFLGHLNAAMEDLRDKAALLAAGIAWIVYSDTAVAGDAVVGGWVDDAYDTQRRRGPRAASRLVWS